MNVLFMLVIKLSSGMVSDFHSPFSSHKFKENYTGDFFMKGEMINLEAVEKLVFRSNTLAVNQKGGFPVAQLECASGCENFMPEVVVCVNRGWLESLGWFDWGCAALMPRGYSFKEHTVQCVSERPNSATFVWIGSCRVKFSLENAAAKKPPSKSTGTKMWCGVKNLSKVCRALEGNKTQSRKTRRGRHQTDEYEYADDGVIFDPAVYSFVVDNVSPLTEDEIWENERIRRERREYFSNAESYSFASPEHEVVVRPAVPNRRTAVEAPEHKPSSIPVQEPQKEEAEEQGEVTPDEDDSWIAGLLLVLAIALFSKFR